MAIKLIGSTYDKATGIKERLINSYLELKFYTDNSSSFRRRYVPFLGDVTISESRKANYVNYNPLSRNSSIPYYLGSESRIFKVAYEMSPNFLLQNPGFIDFVKSIAAYSPDMERDEKDKFFEYLGNGAAPNTQTPFQRDYGAKHMGTATGQMAVINNDLDDEILIYGFIDHQVNLIRSCVVNNAVSPTLGPPLVRLNHGLLYQNVPCICVDYSIEQQYDDTNKKDYHTTYKVSKYKVLLNFTLQELRTGDFLASDFEPLSGKANQDNIVGWEQVITKNRSFDSITPIYK